MGDPGAQGGLFFSLSTGHKSNFGGAIELFTPVGNKIMHARRYPVLPRTKLPRALRGCFRGGYR